MGHSVSTDDEGHILINGVVDPPLLLEVIKRHKSEALEAIRDNLHTALYTDVQDVPRNHRYIILHRFSGAIEVVT